MNDFEKACSEEDFDGNSFQENVIEFLRNADKATVNFCQGRYVSKIRRLAEQYPEECKIVSDVDDVVVAHVPVRWVKISPPRQISDETREMLAERLKEIRETSE